MQEQEVAKIEVGDGAAIPTPDDRGLVSAWWIALIGAVALLVLLPVIKPDPYLNILRFVPDGILITFQVTVLSISLAIVIGLFTGLGRISSNRLINLVASLYVEVVRGIPLLVQLFYIYYALGRFVRVPDLVAAVIAMAFCYGAYMGEVFRAGIKSIDRGQTEAALSLGFNNRQTMACRRPGGPSCRRCATRSSPCSRTPRWSPSSPWPTSSGAAASTPRRASTTSRPTP